MLSGSSGMVFEMKEFYTEFDKLSCMIHYQLVTFQQVSELSRGVFLHLVSGLSASECRQFWSQSEAEQMAGCPAEASGACSPSTARPCADHQLYCENLQAA